MIRPTFTDIFRLPNGCYVNLWEADAWATKRGHHVEALWPPECQQWEVWVARSARPPRRFVSSSIDRRHILALFETGHAISDIAQFMGFELETIQTIINAEHIRATRANRYSASAA